VSILDQRLLDRVEAVELKLLADLRQHRVHRADVGGVAIDEASRQPRLRPFSLVRHGGNPCLVRENGAPGKGRGCPNRWPGTRQGWDAAASSSPRGSHR